MLTNVCAYDELYSLARARARDFTTTTVSLSQGEALKAEGWAVDRESKKSVRLKRPKSSGLLLEDRVWTLFHRMGFDFMSGEGGAKLNIAKDGTSADSQIDVVALDSEIAIAVECKSSASPTKRPHFTQELGKHALIRDRFAAAIRSQFPLDHKRQVVLAFFFDNALLTENDLLRAKADNVLVFREQELDYYEELVNHLGSAAKYQFLADMLPGKSIPGLAIRVPAIRTRMGEYSCYTFSIKPEYLLKIAYVSHRSKGRASDVDTYQRMLKKGRLKTIRDFIVDDGIFPTNIVINVDKNRLSFEKSHQEGDDKESGTAGWLDIRAAYKSAWIIDGQHRLFAYSGLEQAAKSKLCVVAFENLAPSQQAKLFIDINAKQKSVKQSLLMELVAELNWDSDDELVRAGAIISKAVQVLDAELSSPLRRRILMANASKDAVRCISLTSLYSVIEKANFLTRKVKSGLYDHGPLWAGDNDATLRRSVYIIERWLTVIRDSNLDWWNRGSGPGGGIAMNDGVATCINVLRSVFAALDNRNLWVLDNEDLFQIIKPYAEALSRYLSSLTEQQRQSFRDLRGIQGVTRRTRDCQRAIRATMPTFNPEGLDKFIEEQNSQTNLKGKEVIDRIERTLQKVVLEELKRECGPLDAGWWTLGVPKAIRVRIRQSEEEDGGKRPKEGYFNLIDYSKIAVQNWTTFSAILGRGKGGNKEAKLSWLSFVNEKRNIVSHVSSGMNLSFDELAELDDIDAWLQRQVTSASPEDATADADEDGVE